MGGCFERTLWIYSELSSNDSLGVSLSVINCVKCQYFACYIVFQMNWIRAFPVYICLYLCIFASKNILTVTWRYTYLNTGRHWYHNILAVEIWQRVLLSLKTVRYIMCVWRCIINLCNNVVFNYNYIFSLQWCWQECSISHSNTIPIDTIEYTWYDLMRTHLDILVI